MGVCCGTTELSCHTSRVLHLEQSIDLIEQEKLHISLFALIGASVITFYANSTVPEKLSSAKNGFNIPSLSVPMEVPMFFLGHL
ncbi:hypothetical protein SUGI_0439730 [Cryptomeria japonica]|nr:hypothetical protein SUGI_0439730 [Cryptomeria japonica]